MQVVGCLAKYWHNATKENVPAQD